MMKKLSVVVLSLAMAATAGMAQAAGDAAAGKAKAGTCAGCHGANGISMNPMWPNLAGQKAPYLVKQMKAFKAGTRQEPMMKPMMAPLSETDMENLAAYFSSLK